MCSITASNSPLYENDDTISSSRIITSVGLYDTGSM